MEEMVQVVAQRFVLFMGEKREERSQLLLWKGIGGRKGSGRMQRWLRSTFRLNWNKISSPDILDAHREDHF